MLANIIINIKLRMKSIVIPSMNKEKEKSRETDDTCHHVHISHCEDALRSK